MTIWKLTPIDPMDPAWEASSHREFVVVRAPREDAARQAAEEAFGVKTRFAPGAGVKAPPWLRKSLVMAEPISDPRYDPDGRTEVLEPAFPEMESAE